MRNDPFALFCRYYLGLTAEGRVRFSNANQIAKQLNWTVSDLMDVLSRHDLHPDTVLNTDFPLSRYQVDMQIAAETASDEELRDHAWQIYQEFRMCGRKRDWQAEIEREKAEDAERRRNQRYN